MKTTKKSAILLLAIGMTGTSQVALADVADVTECSNLIEFGVKGAIKEPCVSDS